MIEIYDKCVCKIMFQNSVPYLYFEYKGKKHYIDNFIEVQHTLKKMGWSHLWLSSCYNGIVIKFSGFREVTVARYEYKG